MYLSLIETVYNHVHRWQESSFIYATSDLLISKTKLQKVGQKFLINIPVVAGLFCNLFAVVPGFIKLESFNPDFFYLQNSGLLQAILMVVSSFI